MVVATATGKAVASRLVVALLLIVLAIGGGGGSFSGVSGLSSLVVAVFQADIVGNKDARVLTTFAAGEAG